MVLVQALCFISTQVGLILRLSSALPNLVLKSLNKFLLLFIS